MLLLLLVRHGHHLLALLHIVLLLDLLTVHVLLVLLVEGKRILTAHCYFEVGREGRRTSTDCLRMNKILL